MKIELEKAAKDYYDKVVDETVCHHAAALTYAEGYEDARLLVKDAFKAGAEWEAVHIAQRVKFMAKNNPKL